MKKYLLMLAAGAALLMTGCKNEKPKTPPVVPPEGEFVTAKLNGAQYYGEVLAEGTGCYNIDLSYGNNVLRLSFVSTVSADSENAKLQGGKYEKATGDEYVQKTYFFTDANDEDHDKYGTYYAVNGTETAVTEGTVNVTSSAGGYTIKAELKAGETVINWQYSGQIEFENLAGQAPIKPVTADQYNAMYLGEYGLSDTPLGLVYIMMANSANPYTIMRIALSVPMPEDADKVTIPTGKFSFVEYANAEGQAIAGTVDALNILYSATYSVSPTTGNLASGYLLNAGEVTVNRNDDGTYNVHILADGKEIKPNGDVVGSVEGIEWTLENAAFGDYASDETRPYANITEDKTFTSEDLPNIAPVTQFVDDTTSPTMFLWRLVFSNGDIVFTDNTQTQSYNVSGNEGEAIALQFVSKYGDDISVMYGEYPFAYGGETGTAIAVPAGAPGDYFAPFAGCWYLKIGPNEAGQLAALEYAGIPEAGNSKLKVSGDGTNITFEFEMYDKHGKKVSGTKVAAIEDLLRPAAAGTALMTMPEYNTAAISSFAPVSIR